MMVIIKFLGVVILATACLCAICTVLEIKAKRKVYEIIEKICLFMIAIAGLLVGAIGLLAK